MAGNSLWLSTNPRDEQPSRVAVLAADPDPSNFLTSFAVAPSNSNVIWAMRRSGGKLHKTTNGLAALPTWQTITIPAPKLGIGVRLFIDPDDANIVYATFSGTSGSIAWRTDDGGASWRDISGPLRGPVYSITRHPKQGDWLYAGTETGLYYSADRGKSWYATRAGPGMVPVEDLFWYDGNVLIAATYGRGMYKGTFSPGATPGVLDVDASEPSTKYDALTDGVLLLRYLFGLSGSALVNGALGASAARTDPTAVKSYLDSIRLALDVDGNGRADALTDGLLLLRYFFGLRGQSLVAGAVGSDATRTTAASIESYIQSLMP